MNNILIYTFRTFPWIEDIKSISKDIVVLDTLKIDIIEVEKKLKQNKYVFVLGIAKGRHSSVFETKGVNQFNKGKILTDGKEEYPLYFPKQGFENIKVNKGYTTSFCNWGMYRVSKLIEESSHESKHMFVHIKEEDIPVLSRYITSE
ncbi:hypothetical protein CVU76_02885 [Candidatus Dojkabacteria bacterium HGW-Dojkabacteria-1]|uniref:Uncharacterized protein n=1 Tax=Candidatus Dojkabacteria bacterium HGW-Dojkabacteria-1 TaxID=2013761 RepID=A0A2N2F402_9BACT|nr:MAG: hypothetical protein CVU76_02885 [Candidatus Dojkabacteria bacterium HGW-Dojkabacteria-1]